MMSRVFMTSFVYAFNQAPLKASLWTDLLNIVTQGSCHWLVLEDFNCIMHPFEKLMEDLIFKKILMNCQIL
uniref:Uncharacterized protein n=1 Tax=Kalanchoe fedtschenkoi TaxID=63787 RepID=A0A7N0UDH4_KALFE